MLRNSKYGYLLAFVLPILVIAGYYLGGWWNVLNPLFVFIAIPVLDKIIGVDSGRILPSELERRKEDKFFKTILYLWVIVQIPFVVWASIYVNYVESISAIILFTLGTGLVTGGIGITVAHEFGHKKSELERFCSKLLLMTVYYMHFYIEHNKGHHVWVGTDQDPATASKNQSFYSFWVQSVFGGYISAWKIEAKRLKRKGISAYNLRNNMIWFTILPFAFGISLAAIGYHITGSAITTLLFFFAQSFVAFTLLELVNYVEHYGLRRRLDSEGKPVRVDEMHSWNSSHIISNYFLFHLQRHSDHHIHAIKEYQALEHIEKSPQLPSGYPTMILMALIPPLWFSRVNIILATTDN